MKSEGFNSFSQFDVNLTRRQSLTASFALYPQKFNYLGSNTFTSQTSTPDLHQRGYMASIQHRYATGVDSLLLSQFSYKRFDADVTATVQELADEGVRVGFTGTGDLPWAEIDDPRDLDFARLHIFPSLTSQPIAA